MGRDPGDKVRDLLRRERCPVLAPPIRHSKICTTDDDRGSQRLIAHKSEKTRIDDVVALRAAMAFGAMAARTRCRVDTGSPPRISQRRSIGRWGRAQGRFGTGPLLPQTVNESIDLLARERATTPRGKCGHCRPGDAVFDYGTQPIWRNEREIQGIVERQRRTAPTIGSVAAGAVVRIQGFKVCGLRRLVRIPLGSARKRIASRRDQGPGDGHEEAERGSARRAPPHRSRSEGAWLPGGAWGTGGV